MATKTRYRPNRKHTKKKWGAWRDESQMLAFYPKPHNFVAAYVNNYYCVMISHENTEWGEVQHLWIRNEASTPIRNHWATLQRIKNELIGSELVAVEVYPKVSELVDQANMYHLWVMPQGVELPFNLQQ